ncbi:MAG: hypothetical protein CMJ46_09225 [Planctomyces sp.]|nr:hypothetical protein [Planctomyces sp.]
MFTLLGNLTNRLIIAKFLPPLAIIGILTLMVMPGWGTPKFREGDVHELFVVRASAAIALCLIISLAGFRIGIAAFGNFIRKDKPIPPPVARVRTLIIILVLLAPVAWLFFSYEEPQERFSLLAAGGLICLIVLYDAAFTHILHMEAQKRLANKPDEAEDVVVDFELIDNDKEEADTPNAD